MVLFAVVAALMRVEPDQWAKLKMKMRRASAFFVAANESFH